MPRPRSSAAAERENASWACFDAAYRPAGAKATVPATETTLTTCATAGRLERGEERTQAPDSAEVVRVASPARSAPARRRGSAAARDAGVVDEQADPWMALDHRRRGPFDGGAVADVADLELGADRLRQRAQLLGAAREQDAVPAARGELRAVASPMPVEPPVTTATRSAQALTLTARGAADAHDLPRLRRSPARVRHDRRQLVRARRGARRPPGRAVDAGRVLRAVAICRFPSKKPTERSARARGGDLEPRRPLRRSRRSGEAQPRQRRAGDDLQPPGATVVFGIASSPGGRTFFASWKSEATTRSRRFPR